MYTSFYFPIYKLFNKPPGTPKDLRCVGCKKTVSGVSFLAALATMYGSKRCYKEKVMKATTLGIVAVAFLCVSGVAFRLAIQDQDFNQKLISEARKQREKSITTT